MTTTKIAFQSITPDSADVAIGGYSPVSYFDSGRPEQGEEQFAVTHQGRTYYMKSADQAASFRSNPDKYAPSYDGWCSYGMSVEKEFPIDPESFKIVDGKLLLFFRNDEVDARELWNKENEGESVGKADRFFESR